MVRRCLLSTACLLAVAACSPAQTPNKLTAEQYQSVMSRSEDYTIKNYRAGPQPKVLFLCVDWAQTKANYVADKGSLASTGGRADLPTIKARAAEKCRELEQEQAQRFPCKCVLVDVNGAPPE